MPTFWDKFKAVCTAIFMTLALCSGIAVWVIKQWKEIQ